MDTTWTVLRKFGYDNALELRPDLCQGALSQLGHFHPDQCVEITDSGRDFLRLKFRQHDKDADGVLSDAELRTSPPPPASPAQSTETRTTAWWTPPGGEGARAREASHA